MIQLHLLGLLGTKISLFGASSVELENTNKTLLCHSCWEGFPQLYVNKDFFTFNIIHAFPVQNNRQIFSFIFTHKFFLLLQYWYFFYVMLIIISYLSHLYNIDVEHQEQQWRTHGHPVARNLLNAEHASKQDEEA